MLTGPNSLLVKARELIDIYNQDRVRLSQKDAKFDPSDLDEAIKWSRAVKRDLVNGVPYDISDGTLVSSLYRPFTKRKLYFSRRLNEMVYQIDRLFPQPDTKNPYISIVAGSRLSFCTIAGDALPNYAMLWKR